MQHKFHDRCGLILELIPSTKFSHSPFPQLPLWFDLFPYPFLFPFPVMCRCRWNTWGMRMSQYCKQNHSVEHSDSSVWFLKWHGLDRLWNWKKNVFLHRIFCLFLKIMGNQRNYHLLYLTCWRLIIEAAALTKTILEVILIKKRKDNNQGQ